LNKTPCDKLGYQVGDKFEILESSCGFKEGKIVELFGYDGSDTPLFKGENDQYRLCDGTQGAYLLLHKVRKLTATEESKNEQLKQMIERRNKKLAKFRLLTCQGKFQNVHDVPEEKVKQMRENF